MPKEPQLLLYPHPFLRKPAREATEEEIKSPDTKKLIEHMINIMETNEGIGLAATQIGIGLRFFVANHHNNILTIFNPVLDDVSGSVGGEEGCLSVPDIKTHLLERAQSLNLTGLGLRHRYPSPSFPTRS